MHSKKVLSMVDTVTVAVIIPLASVFYFTTIRKHFKEMPENGAVVATPQSLNNSETNP